MILGRLFSRSLLTPTVEAALNAQIKSELSASVTYMAASNWYDSKNLTHIKDFLRKESNEEKQHAEVIIDYINKRNGKAVVPSVEPAEIKYQKHDLIFTQLMDMEIATEKSLHSVVLAAKAEGDVATEMALHQLVLDQIDSIDEWDAMVEELETFANMQGLIWHFDKKL